MRIPIARSASKIDEVDREDALNEDAENDGSSDPNAPVSPLSSRISLDRASLRIEPMGDPELSK